MDYDTINLFGLQPTDVQNLSITRENDLIIISITLTQKIEVCPICGSLHSHVKDYKLRKISHSLFNMNKSVIYYRCRRFKCIDCGKTFVESNPFSSRKQRISNATILVVLKDCKRLNYTFSSIAEKNHISPSTVINIFDQYVDMKPAHLPRVLSIDEFYLGTFKNKFACIFIDWESAQIIDIYPSRKKYDLYSYMQYIDKKDFENVQYLSLIHI